MSDLERLATTLADLVGYDHVLTSADHRAPYETDWTRRWSAAASLVVRPADTAQVAGVVGACRAAGQPLVAQGGNTGLVGGSVPRGGEVVVSLTRLDTVEAVDTAAAQVTAGAGVTLGTLQHHAATAGFAFPVDFAARNRATVGGMVATNAGGVQVPRYGSMRAQLVGVEAVRADGRVLTRLSGLTKDNAGYDVPGLLAGSEGTLALVTRARLRLVPALPMRVTALVGVDDTAAAVSLTEHLRSRLPTLEAAEVVYADGVELVCTHRELPAPLTSRHPAYVLVECAGHEDPIDALTAALADASQGREHRVASDHAGREALWLYRMAQAEAVGAAGVPHKLDVAVPLRSLSDFEQAVRARITAAVPGSRTVLWGHLADGNLHVNVLPPGDAGSDVHEQLDETVLGLVAEQGGTISAEHGVGVSRRRWLSLVRDRTDIATMRAVKDALDPDGMLNPGVLFPSRSE